MTIEPIPLRPGATLFHTRAGDIILGISWLAADRAREAGLPLVVELTSDRDVEGVRYHLHSYVNLDSDLHPRSVGPTDAFISSSNRERAPGWEERLEAVRRAWAADVVALTPELVTPRAVVPIYRYGAEARLRAAEDDVRIARQKLADAEEAARRAVIIREEACALSGEVP